MGVKRAAGWGPASSRPTKLRRQGSGPSDVADAIAMNLSATDSGGGGVVYEPVAFVRSPARAAVSSFDWSDLTGVLNCGPFESPDHVDDLFVYVPGAVRPVVISKQVILKQLIDNLGLQVYGHGVVIESASVMRGWIEMDLPPSGVLPIRKRERFLSAEAFGRYEAMEGACGAAISHLQRECFVLVEDINYQQLRVLQNRATAAETLGGLLQGVVDSGEDDNKAIRDGYAAFVLEACRLCKDFTDVFPPGTIGYESTSNAPDDGKIYYSGPRPPVTRVDQFALRLLDLINMSANVPVVGHNLVQE